MPMNIHIKPDLHLDAGLRSLLPGKVHVTLSPLNLQLKPLVREQKSHNYLSFLFSIMVIYMYI